LLYFLSVSLCNKGFINYTELHRGITECHRGLLRQPLNFLQKVKNGVLSVMHRNIIPLPVHFWK